MSQRAKDNERSWTFVGDTDLFFFFLRGGSLEEQAKKVVDAAEDGPLVLRTSSEVYDDAISAIRAGGVSLEVANEFVSDMKSITHVALPISAEIAEEAVALYRSHGGRRKLSYFDSFHVATAKRYDIPLLTSDKFILQNAGTFGIETADLADWGKTDTLLPS